MFKAVMKLFRSLTTLLLGLTTAASVALAAPTGLGTGSASTGSPFAGGGQPKTVTVQLVSRQTAGIPRATNDIGILLKHEPGWHTYWQFSGLERKVQHDSNTNSQQRKNELPEGQSEEH